MSLSIFAGAPNLLGQEEEEGKNKPAELEVEDLCKDYYLDMSSYKKTHKAAELFSWEDAALSKRVIKSTSATAFYLQYSCQHSPVIELPRCPDVVCLL